MAPASSISRPVVAALPAAPPLFNVIFLSDTVVLVVCTVASVPEMFMVSPGPPTLIVVAPPCVRPTFTTCMLVPQPMLMVDVLLSHPKLMVLELPGKLSYDCDTIPEVAVTVCATSVAKAGSVGRRAAASVPVVMLVALVVSVVADAARPETADAAIATLLAVMPVTRPVASTVSTG